jgi:hypothetical protein
VGTRIVDFIASLRDAGVAVIYSNDLVPESLRIVDEPDTSDPVDRLRQVLAPHGLALEAGPRASWLVVRAAPLEPPPAPLPVVPPPARPSVPTLETLIVTASRYAFTRSTATSAQQIDRLQLEYSPTLGEDALRTTHGLPGLTSSGLTARVNVRGGEADEALLLLDGVRLYDPFHLKGFQSLFGSVSPRIIDLVDVRTGGYPASFGDRMSAVIEMHSLVPTDKRHYEVGVSTLTSSVLSSGRFADERGAWLTSARRGNLDLLIDAAQSDVGQPQYTDFFNKLSYSFDDRVTVTTGALALDDKITLSDDDITEAGADYDDTYLWVELDHRPTPRLAGRYLISRARLASYRSGRIDDPDIAFGTLSDRRRFEVETLRGDWSFDIGDTQRLEWGIEADSATAKYEFASARVLPYPIQVPELAVPGDVAEAELALTDRQRAAYASYRVQPVPRFTAELGLRRDEQSYLDESQVSPRVAAMLDLGSRATLRASWGRFYQAQGINEVQVEDGLTELFRAQEAEHAVLSFEYLFSDSLSLRAEIYEKEFERVRPRFENLFMRVSLLPELLPDRVMLEPLSAAAEGIELSLDAQREHWQWWLSFTRSSIEDQLAARWAKRSWEEPWSAKGGAIWGGPRWTTAVTITMRSGWPITDLALVGNDVAGTYNAVAFENFRSLDVRASRNFALERGSLEFFVELNNALDAENPCCFDYELATNAALEPVGLTIDTHNWLPVIPTLGFLWQF